jgi:hypothetical protein
MTSHQVGILLVSMIAMFFIVGTTCLILDSFIKSKQPERICYRKPKPTYTNYYEENYPESNSVIIDYEGGILEEKDDSQSTVSGINTSGDSLNSPFLNFDDDDDFNHLLK